MEFLSNCMKGIAIGAGAILPGVSSGVLCVIFGIYEKLLDAVLGFFKNIKENFKFLLPIIIGIGIGVVLFSNLLNYLFYTFPIQTKSIFIGLILGGVPTLFKEVNNKEKFKLINLIYVIIAFGIGLLTVILEKNMAIQSTENINFVYLIISGFLMSVGVVVPGVSSTIILMLLGVYAIYLQSVSTIYFPILIPMGIGLIAGGIFFMNVTKFMLKKFYVQTFYTIIGFSLGSILVLFPEITFDINGVIAILCVILGFQLIHCQDG